MKSIILPAFGSTFFVPNTSTVTRIRVIGVRGNRAAKNPSNYHAVSATRSRFFFFFFFATTLGEGLTPSMPSHPGPLKFISGRSVGGLIKIHRVENGVGNVVSRSKV